MTSYGAQRSPASPEDTPHERHGRQTEIRCGTYLTTGPNGTSTWGHWLGRGYPLGDITWRPRETRAGSIGCRALSPQICSTLDRFASAIARVFRTVGSFVALKGDGRSSRTQS